jgi:hypothetical protein
LAELAELYNDATNTTRALAAELSIPLRANLYGPSRANRDIGCVPCNSTRELH